MGWMRGFEPPTSGSTIRRSNQLTYTHHQDRKNAEIDSIKRPQAAARSVAAKVGADGGDFLLDFVRRLGGIFRIADRAVKFVRDAGLSKKEMELVLAFENPLYNVTVPVDQRFEHRA